MEQCITHFLLFLLADDVLVNQKLFFFCNYSVPVSLLDNGITFYSEQI